MQAQANTGANVVRIALNQNFWLVGEQTSNALCFTFLNISCLRSKRLHSLVSHQCPERHRLGEERRHGCAVFRSVFFLAFTLCLGDLGSALVQPGQPWHRWRTAADARSVLYSVLEGSCNDLQKRSRYPLRALQRTSCKRPLPMWECCHC